MNRHGKTLNKNSLLTVPSSTSLAPPFLPFLPAFRNNTHLFPLGRPRTLTRPRLNPKKRRQPTPPPKLPALPQEQPRHPAFPSSHKRLDPIIPTSAAGNVNNKNSKENQNEGDKEGTEDGEAESLGRQGEGSFVGKDGQEVDSVERLPPVQEANTPSTGLGAALWVHRFLYRSKIRSAHGRQREEEEKSGAEEVKTESEEEKVRGAAPVSRPAAWSELRSRLVRAKITDALTNTRFDVAGKTYTALRTLGEGGYSKVYEVFDSDKSLYALKVVNLSDVSDNLRADLVREIDLLLEFQSSLHVIQLIEHEHVIRENGDKSEDMLYMLMERGECDLNHLINLSSMTPARLRFYWEQMLESVQTLHHSGVIHCDLKPANFVLTCGRLKVIDLGLATRMVPGSGRARRTFARGTRDYMSPESMAFYIIEDGAINIEAMAAKDDQETEVTAKSDVWALGVILYQLAYGGVSPYSYVPGGRLGKLKALVTMDLPVDLEPLEDKYLFDTLKRCLEKDPAKRAGIQELLCHPFLRPPSEEAMDT